MREATANAMWSLRFRLFYVPGAFFPSKRREIVAPRALVGWEAFLEKKANSLFCQAVKQPLKGRSPPMMLFERERELGFNNCSTPLT